MKTAVKGIVLTVVALAGCASTTDNLQRESARSIGGMTSGQVAVTDVQRGITNVSWKASAPDGNYRCEADDMLRRVNCVKEAAPKRR